MSIISVGTAYAVHIGEGVLQDLAGAVPAGVARALIVEQAAVTAIADRVEEALRGRGIDVVREVVPLSLIHI